MSVNFYSPGLLVNYSASGQLVYKFANPASEELHCLFQDCSALGTESIFDPATGNGSPTTYGMYVPAVESQRDLDSYYGRMDYGSAIFYLFFKVVGGASSLHFTTELSSGFQNSIPVKAVNSTGFGTITISNFSGTSLICTNIDGGVIIIGVLDTLEEDEY